MSHLEGVRKIIDVEQLADFGRAACEEDGKIVAWHVTDDAPKVMAMLKKKANFLKAYGGHRSELGPGFYVSCVPEFWVGRSTKKWAFVAALSPEQRTSILEALSSEIVSRRQRGRITDSEARTALRWAEGAAQAGSLEGVIQLAGQPFSIPWFREDWLRPFGIRAYVPEAVKVQLLGRYAELAASYVAPEILRRLRRLVDGVFTRASMATNAELCVFHGSSMRLLGVESLRS